VSDVSVPPTHPDDQAVTRKILREELQAQDEKIEQRFQSQDEKIEQRFQVMEESLLLKMEQRFQAQDENLGRALKSMEESLLSKMVAIMEPTKDTTSGSHGSKHGPRS
jgi:hypothetical protein